MSRCTLVAAVVVVSLAAPAFAGPIQLTFSGNTDRSSGFTVGSLPAPQGSPFTLDIVIDDATAATGVYPVLDIGYTLTVGSYSTVTDWSTITDLVATQVGPSITLVSNPLFANPGEHFLLNLSSFGSAVINDPLSWAGPGPITGDIIVRGVGGFGSGDELSGASSYQGSLSLGVSVVPEPTTLALLGMGLAGLVAWRRKRRKA